MATIPKRLLILQRLQTLLTGITDIGLGTPVDLTDKVFRGRILLGAEIRPLPVLSLLESPRPDQAADLRSDWDEWRSEGWTLLVQGMIDDDPINPTDRAYYLQAAVEQRLSLINATNVYGEPVDPAAFNLGGLIHCIEIGPPVVRPPEDKVSATGFFFQPIRLGIAGRIDEPYTTV